MKLKGKYVLNYLLNRKPETLTVEVKLKMVDGLLKPRQNVWEGFATVDDKPYNDDNLKFCVDAKLYAEIIGNKLKNDLRKEHGRKLRVKQEKTV